MRVDVATAHARPENASELLLAHPSLQDEDSCAVFGMPRAAIERGAARLILRTSRPFAVGQVIAATLCFSHLLAPIDVTCVVRELSAPDDRSPDRAMRGGPRWAHLPTLVISVGRDGVRSRALATGAELYLDKPVLLEHLLNTRYAPVGTAP